MSTITTQEHGHDHHHEHGEACCGHDHDHKHDHDHNHHHEPDNYASAEKSFFFSLEVVVLFVWGGILTYYVASGKVIPFLATTGIFREQALIGGMALMVLALFNFAMRHRFPACCGHDHEEEEGHEHHHHEESSWMSRVITVFILVAPVGLAAAFAPPDWTENYKMTMANSVSASNAPVGASAMTKQLQKESGGAENTKGGFTLDDFKKYAPPTAEGHFKLSVADLWSLAGDPDVRKVLAGQIVETSAQVVQDAMSKDVKANRLRVFELQMTCCAADSRPVSFPIEFEGPLPDYREMGWYKVTGKVDFLDERGGKVTVIRVTEMTPTTRPKTSGPAI